MSPPRRNCRRFPKLYGRIPGEIPNPFLRICAILARERWANQVAQSERSIGAAPSRPLPGGEITMLESSRSEIHEDLLTAADAERLLRQAARRYGLRRQAVESGGMEE